jgi:hypothetical protein
MQDDFDSGMGIPDDELAGESAMSEGDTLGGHDGDVELEAPESEPVGRASGGARAMASGAKPRKGGQAIVAAKPAKKAAKPAKKAVKKAAKKTAKPVKKTAKAARKSAPKKAAKKAAKKSAKKKSAPKRKAGKKK